MKVYYCLKLFIDHFSILFLSFYSKSSHYHDFSTYCCFGLFHLYTCVCTFIYHTMNTHILFHTTTLFKPLCNIPSSVDWYIGCWQFLYERNPHNKYPCILWRQCLFLTATQPATRWGQKEIYPTTLDLRLLGVPPMFLLTCLFLANRMRVFTHGTGLFWTISTTMKAKVLSITDRPYTITKNSCVDS